MDFVFVLFFNAPNDQGAIEASRSDVQGVGGPCHAVDFGSMEAPFAAVGLCIIIAYRKQSYLAISVGRYQIGSVRAETYQNVFLGNFSKRFNDDDQFVPVGKISDGTRQSKFFPFVRSSSSNAVDPDAISIAAFTNGDLLVVQDANRRRLVIDCGFTNNFPDRHLQKNEVNYDR